MRRVVVRKQTYHILGGEKIKFFFNFNFLIFVDYYCTLHASKTLFKVNKPNFKFSIFNSIESSACEQYRSIMWGDIDDEDCNAQELL